MTNAMKTTAWEIGKLDSDSVSPGSNPGSPASLLPIINNMLEEIRNRGNPRIAGKFGQSSPHKSRHSYPHPFNTDNHGVWK